MKKLISKLLSIVLYGSSSIGSLYLPNTYGETRTGIEEIVVTAQKREENLQETPISITAFSENTIKELGISDITDLSKFAPNLHIVSTAGDGTGATVQMRGTVTTNPAITFEPTVGIYLDGFFIAKNTGNVFALPDLERIEVLRGPQGTLYGKNTVGGAINLISRKPSGEFKGTAAANFGNFDAIKTTTNIHLPAIGEVGAGAGRLASKIALVTSDRDGFFENQFQSGNGLGLPVSQDMSDEDSISGRVALQWNIIESLEISYAYDFNRTRQSTPYFQLTEITPDGIFDANGSICTAAPPTGCRAGFGLDQYVSTGRADTGSNDRGGQNNIDVDGHSLTITWDAGKIGPFGDVTIKSLTGDREVSELSNIDLDGSNLDIAAFIRDIEYEQFSQEFQWIGNTDSVEYVAGLYYFEEESDVVNPGRFFGLFEQLNPLTTINDVISNYGINKNDTFAIYGQAAWSPTDVVTITAGLRYTEESKDLYRFRVEANGTVSVPLTNATDNYYDLSPMLSVGWQVAEDINIYAKYSEGFKSGGFNQAATSVEAFTTGFDSEEINSYEVGMKSRWLKNRLQLNVAAFFSDYTNLQISNFIPSASGGAISVINNAGEAEIQGLEFELIAQPIEDLNIFINYAYLDGEYQRFIEFDSATNQNVDVKNQRAFPYIFEHSGSIGIAYTFAHFDFGDLAARVDWSYIDDHFIFSADFESTAVDAFNLVDARLTLKNIPLAEIQTLEVALWGKNLTDEEYRTSGIDFGAFGFTGNHFGDPRTYGIEFTYGF